MKGESRASNPAPASDFNRPPILPRDALVVLLTEYGDWGNACMAAYGTPLWPLHLARCAECRAVQARWDAEQDGAA